MNDRIKTLITYLGLSTRAFAISCGIRQNTLSNQLNGVRELSLSTVIAILSAYPDVSSEWLMRGEGKMTKEVETSKEAERIVKLSNVIETLQEVIDNKNSTIATLNEKIKQLENK